MSMAEKEREKERIVLVTDDTRRCVRCFVSAHASPLLSSLLLSSSLLFSSGNHESAERVAKKLHSGESRTVLPFHISDRHRPVTEEAERDRRRLAREAGEAARGEEGG